MKTKRKVANLIILIYNEIISKANTPTHMQYQNHKHHFL